MENDNEPNNTAAETTPENGQPSPPPIPEKRLTKTEELQAQFVAMDKPATLPNTIDALLKKPASVLHDLQNGNFFRREATLVSSGESGARRWHQRIDHASESLYL